MAIFKSKEEREFIKKQKKADKELMKQIDAEIKEQDRKEYEAFIDEMLLSDNKEEKYLESIMTEEEKKEIEGNKKVELGIMISAATIISIIIVVVSIVAFTADYMGKSELVKETVPIIKEYYKERYNKELEYLDIDYLCTTNENNEEVCSDIAIMITTDNRHILSVNNGLIGDDINTSAITNAYNEDMRLNLASLDLVSNYPILSYKDYYIDYNIHLDHIHALPSNKDYKTLKDSKKLTVTEFIFYNGDYDANIVNNYIANFSEDSEFYFVKNIRGIPSNLTVVKKGKTEVFNISATIPFDYGMYYELDRNKNSTSNVTVTRMNGEDITVEGDYKFTNAYKIIVDGENNSWDRDKNKSSYFFIKLNDVYFDEANIYQFTVSSYSDHFDEISADKYIPVITFNNGTDTYMIGTESVGIGNISVQDSFLCKIGLC